MNQIRKYKIFGLAIFDLVSAILGMISIFIIIRTVRFPKLELWKFIIWAIIVTIPVGIVFHILLGVNTQLNYNLGLSYKPN
jgi:hypothetical protein